MWDLIKVNHRQNKLHTEFQKPFLSFFKKPKHFCLINQTKGPWFEYVMRPFFLIFFFFQKSNFFLCRLWFFFFFFLCSRSVSHGGRQRQNESPRTFWDTAAAATNKFQWPNTRYFISFSRPLPLEMNVIHSLSVIVFCKKIFRWKIHYLTVSTSRKNWLKNSNKLIGWLLYLQT